MLQLLPGRPLAVVAVHILIGAKAVNVIGKVGVLISKGGGQFWFGHLSVVFENTKVVIYSAIYSKIFYVDAS